MDPGSGWRQYLPIAFGLAAAFGTIGVAVSLLPVKQAPPGQAYGRVAGLGFDYPATWQLELLPTNGHYLSELALLASDQASASAVCDQAAIPGLGGTCTDRFVIPANSVVLKIDRGGAPRIGGWIATTLEEPGWAARTIGGQPAAFTATAPRVTWMADETLEWMIESPGSGDTAYYDLVASVRGPNTAALVAELDRLVGSITVNSQ